MSVIIPVSCQYLGDSGDLSGGSLQVGSDSWDNIIPICPLCLHGAVPDSIEDTVIPAHVRSPTQLMESYREKFKNRHLTPTTE